MPPSAPPAPSIIDEFAERAWSELALSRNTLSAYRSDLQAFERWLAPRGQALQDASREAIFAYLASLKPVKNLVPFRQLTPPRLPGEIPGRKG